MTGNNNHVTTAERFLESAEAAQVALREEYAKPEHRREQGRIAGLHQAINYGLKTAEVTALISLAASLDNLRPSVSPRPRPEVLS